jgi:APA family basic amino acid/polyamine antiporter
LKNNHTPQKIGLLPAAALVAGNMIGSGIFLLPASLAQYGQLSLLGWLISTAGAILLALTFARLSKLLPLTGGLYLYTQRAYGNFSGFLIAYGYWIAIWVGNAAIAVGFVSNLTPFFPLLKTNAILAAGVSMLTVWGVTLLNLRGVRDAALFQLVTMILRLGPIILIATYGYFFFHWSNLAVPLGSFDPLQVALHTAALTLWSFLGVESATIPASDIKDPQKNIARATIGGTLFSSLIFITASTAVLGIVPKSIMADSASPFADAARQLWGTTGYYLVAAAASISCLGALNGWILLQGQIPWAAAQDGLFPKWFGQKNERGAPVFALVASSVLITILICFNFSKSLQKQFEQMILLATLSSLIPYAFCALAELRLRYLSGERLSWAVHFRLYLLSGATWIFAMAAIIGTGWEIISLGLVMLATGLPIYFWRKKRSTPTASI